MKPIDYKYSSNLHEEKHRELLYILAAANDESRDTFNSEPILTAFRVLTSELARTRAELSELSCRHESLVESLNERLNK